MPNEFDFIHWLRSQQRPSPLVPLPAGDDLAILRWPANDLLLAGVDQVLDGIHFDSAHHTPRQIGVKVMNRNLSDCAAMACLPAAALIAVVLPKGASIDFTKDLYLDIKSTADEFNCQIIGGDTASWPNKLALSVTILARSAGLTPITRSGAKPGDHLYVTGPLGGSILGRHMTFTPRIHLARDLASHHRITAMLDLSDGLSRDLTHICHQSHVAAHLDAPSIPIHKDAIELSRRDGLSPLHHALHDGEDHELLFTSPDLITAPSITQIGQIVPGQGIHIGTPNSFTPLKPQGWEHAL